MINTHAFSTAMAPVESKATLEEFLRQSDLPTRFLGTSAEAPREFFSVQILRDGRPVAYLGILSDGIGIKPAVLLKEGRIVVGFNNRVAVIDSDKLDLIQETVLPSLFWRFLDLALAHLCIICETAIVSIDAEGTVRWQVLTGVIGDFELVGAQLRVKSDDEPVRLIELLSGRVLKES
jgi:hypothetical protein